MRQFPPVAPTSAKGPLGVMQLPRLWCKVLLDAKGLLPEGYSVCGNGYDRIMLEGLGLDREEVLGFLTSELPTYARFEQWVAERLGGAVPQERIDSVNQRLSTSELRPERRHELLTGAGHADDGRVTLGTEINQLDDLAVLHRCLTQED